MKKNQILLLTGMMLMGMFLHAQKTPPSLTLNFDKNWKFHLGHAGDPSMDFNFGIANIFSKSGKAENTAIDPKFNDQEWRTLSLPHDWAVELPFVYSPDFDVQSHGYKPVGGGYPESSVGWYRKHFRVSSADSGQRFSIRFDGIFRDARIWINGFYLGANESGYIGITCDITDYIHYDKENVVVVRVDASQYEGWFYEGAGIYRHVWLNRYNPVHIAENGVYISTKNQDHTADVNLETTISNDLFIPVECTVISYVTERNGKMAGRSTSQTVTIDARGGKTLQQRITLNEPVIWCLENPYLYRAMVVVRTDNRVTDSSIHRFGVRTVQFDAAQGFFLNGNNIKIQGVCCHQDHAGVGLAFPDDLHYYRIRLLKEMGVNAYRSSHNPPAPELLDVCDSLGMLVMDEPRLLNSSPEYMNQFEKLIRRDRNHPSVFLWSIGNEEGYIQTTGIGKRIALSLLASQKKLDPSRTSTYAADLPNVFTGVNEVIPIRGFNYRQYAVDDYHKSHPDQPVIGTEMGSTVTTRGIYEKDTIRCYLPDQDITAPWWASKAEEWWTLCANQPLFMGGFIWTGFDYRGEPTPFQWPNINSHFGIMDMCGFPKNLYYYYQSWWTDNDVLHISPHWNWKGKEGEIIPVWVNTNADRVELFLNGKSLGEKEMPRNSHLKWQVPYQPGELKAIALKKGKKIISRVETTEEPFRVEIIPDKTTLFAGGTDATAINVHVTDRSGREVPDAGNLVWFKVEGHAKIIGVGNGDPSSHEPDQCPKGQWQRKLFNGKCQLILRSEENPGPVEIVAGSEGLISGSVHLTVIN